MTKKILIAGAGYLGMAAARQFLSAGFSVHALTRDPRKADALRGSGIEPRVADLTQESSLPFFEGLDGVLISAAPDRGEVFDYREMYVRGIGNLLRKLDRKRPPLVLYTSSTSVYGPSQQGWLDETVVPEPGHEKGRVLLDAEKQVLDSGMGVIFRLSGLYGPGRNRLESRRAEAAGEPDRYLNLIHRDDAAAASLFLLERARPGEVYLGVDKEPVLRSSLLRWLENPAAFPSQEPADASARRCRAAGLTALGFEFRYPSFREGYGEILKTIQAKGAHAS
ncbi:MAG TPA: NAD-dependent epimerase/dehydratase family protein [Verrucomicrobiae bacterium]|jgi:nucleoside-diphosphate-sugar epimerase|nr:NAD-dependent epimerase/dehydratase family protein [Verrucomicrobiae bacterium]